MLKTRPGTQIVWTAAGVRHWRSPRPSELFPLLKNQSYHELPYKDVNYIRQQGKVFCKSQFLSPSINICIIISTRAYYAPGTMLSIIFITPFNAWNNCRERWRPHLPHKDSYLPEAAELSGQPDREQARWTPQPSSEAPYDMGPHTHPYSCAPWPLTVCLVRPHMHQIFSRWFFNQIS